LVYINKSDRKETIISTVIKNHIVKVVGWSRA